MIKSYDPTIDWLAQAPLTPEQREVWNAIRTEVINSREAIRDLQKRVKLLENTPTPEEQLSVLTRPEFNREVARMLAFNERYGGVSSVIYINLENMDGIATRYGKSVSNAAIRETSNILMKSVRGSDIVGRLASDEFGILLGQCDNANAWKKGQYISGLLHEKLADVHGCKLELKICYGAYTFQENQDIATGLKEAAQVMTRGN